MGMTIEEAIEFKKHGYHTSLSSFKNIDDMDAQISKCADYDRLALDTMRKYQQLQADYENRLKADMVTMLEEISLEIEELDSMAGYDGNGMPTFSTDYIRKKKVNEIIQQKINALKGRK